MSTGPLPNTLRTLRKAIPYPKSSARAVLSPVDADVRFQGRPVMGTRRPRDHRRSRLSGDGNLHGYRLLATKAIGRPRCECSWPIRPVEWRYQRPFLLRVIRCLPPIAVTGRLNCNCPVRRLRRSPRLGGRHLITLKISGSCPIRSEARRVAKTRRGRRQRLTLGRSPSPTFRSAILEYRFTLVAGSRVSEASDKSRSI
jgi:hypothetical protein